MAMKLVLIDEIHLIGDYSRGACIDSAISRLKREDTRLIAVSATIPNINDIANWLGSGNKNPSIVYSYIFYFIKLV